MSLAWVFLQYLATRAKFGFSNFDDTVGFDLNETFLANGRIANCDRTPLSRVPDAGSSNCQLRNDTRISQKIPLSKKMWPIISF